MAINGAIIAALPRQPMNNPLARKRLQRSSAKLAIKAPSAIITEPNSTGCRMPRLSIHQPMMIPPVPAPIIISEKAIDGTQRAVSKSAAIGFKVTNRILGAPSPILFSSNEAMMTTQP